MAIAVCRRALNHMSPDLRLVHLQLEAWASWAKERLPGALPRRTIIGRLMDEGPGASQSRETEPEMPDAVALVDRAVASLGEIDRKVVKAYYLRWAPREVSAAACRMRVRQFDAVLNRARWRISGMLAR